MSLNIKQQNPIFFAVIGTPYIREEHFDSHCHYPDFRREKRPRFAALWSGLFALLVTIIAFGNVHAG